MISKERYTRREWLLAMMAAGVTARHLALNAQTTSKISPSKLAMPGLVSGRVVAVSHPACLVDGQYQAGPIADVMRDGLLELTEAPDLPSAWRSFFEPGDVVGIKVNPVGGPLVISCPEVLREIIKGLESAGVRRKDIVVYDRYRLQFLRMGFDKWLPEGVRWSSATEDYDDVQQGIDGYDPNHYMDMAVTLPAYDVKNERARRSYAAK